MVHDDRPVLAPTLRARRLRTEPPRRGLASRVHFAWLGFWACLLTAVLSPCVVLHSSVRPGAQTFVRWMRPWARGILRAGGYRLHVRQATPLPEGPVVFAANHQNALDVVTTSAALPVPFGYAAKAELRRWPFVGWVLERTACLFVDRSTPRRAAASLIEAAERLRVGDSVLLFPEGGRSWAHALQPFMKGAFLLAIEAGVPVVPVVLAGNSGALDERVLRSLPGDVAVLIGAPISTAGLTRADAERLCAHVEAWMRAELDALA